MQVAAIQHEIIWEDAEATIRRVAPMIHRAVAAGADLVVLPEMYSVGFSMNTDAVAEPADGRSASFLVDTARTLGVTITGSVPTRLDDGACVNRLVVAGPDGELGHYDKIHPFSFAGEDRHYRGGDELVTLDVCGVRCSLFVCYDLRFADEFWAVAERTDCYLLVANWPAARRLHWQTLARARAIENQAWVVAVNRVGEDGTGLAYAGDSMVIDPLGELTASASTDETIVLAEVDPARVADVRARFPFAADRR